MPLVYDKIVLAIDKHQKCLILKLIDEGIFYDRLPYVYMVLEQSILWASYTSKFVFLEIIVALILVKVVV